MTAVPGSAPINPPNPRHSPSESKTSTGAPKFATASRAASLSWLPEPTRPAGSTSEACCEEREESHGLLGLTVLE